MLRGLWGVVWNVRGLLYSAHPLLNDLEQIIAILCQQVKCVDDMRDIFDVRLVEAQAIEGFEQVAGGADALLGGVEQGLGRGMSVDHQYGGVAASGFQRTVTLGHRREGIHGISPVRVREVARRVAFFAARQTIESFDKTQQYSGYGQVL